jgi:hypothetical protein
MAENKGKTKETVQRITRSFAESLSSEVHYHVQKIIIISEDHYQFKRSLSVQKIIIISKDHYYFKRSLSVQKIIISSKDHYQLKRSLTQTKCRSESGVGEQT